MIVGRPVRFVVMVVGSWSVMRVILLLPLMGGAGTSFMAKVQLARPLPAPSGPEHASIQARRTLLSPAMRSAKIAQGRPPVVIGRFAGVGRDADVRDLDGTRIAFAAPTATAPEETYLAQEGGIPGRSLQGASSSRWSGAAWLLWRSEADKASLAPAGRLGGSQAGLRIDYALDPGSALQPALYGRLSGALSRPVAAEAAVGIALRPTAVPLVFGFERRAALSSGGRDDFAFVVAGGLYRQPLTRHLRIDGYGQAGIVGFARPDAFADGRLAVESVLSRLGRQGSGDIAIGAALWGGAQPGLSRLDIGPQATARLPVGETHLRLGGEWRQRIAGDARPASGPAITVGLDF